MIYVIFIYHLQDPFDCLILILILGRRDNLDIGRDHEHLFDQHRELYLMLRQLRSDISSVKEELKRQRNDQENNLSQAVLDVSLLSEINDIHRLTLTNFDNYRIYSAPS